MEDTKWHPTADKINVSLFLIYAVFVLAVNPALEWDSVANRQD